MDIYALVNLDHFKALIKMVMAALMSRGQEIDHPRQHTLSREGGTSPFPAHMGLTKRHHGSERLRIVSSYGDFVSVKSLS
ncbi:hypothetical protein ElyMa_002479100 [Elysia marginata]|uniref:Uncharacterized protein n=1 Tax=Elysia marginata TaxID=1093978 RepID=A0AAV4GMG9_9GAST|nr:hypothetical protein ElyMa_002479100 [Elysia marginata]